MNAKWFAIALVVFFCGAMLVANSSQKEPEKGPQAKDQSMTGERPSPPDIKPGVAVLFYSGAGVFTFKEGPPVNIKKVRGNWIYVEGEFRESASQKRREGWINFDTVTWYVVVKDK